MSRNAKHAKKTPVTHTVKKFRIHIACVAIGMVAAVAMTFIDGSMAHLAILMPAMPSIAQESLDRIFKL